MLSFWPSFCESLTIIFISELADKTFILELIYYPKIGAVPLLITSTLALGLMAAVAISVGYLLPMLVIRSIVDWIGFVAFTLFGIYSIIHYASMERETVAEKVEKENKEKDDQYVAIQDTETGASSQPQNENEENHCNFTYSNYGGMLLHRL